MTTFSEQPTPVSRQLVPEDQRLAVVERHFGIHFPLRLVPVVYKITETMTQGQYQGGYWSFYTLDNGGFYMAPDDDRVFTVCSANYWSGELSADALGITVCLTAFSHLSFGGSESFARICARHYHQLRHFLMDHAEVAAILGAID